jgi:hypothetical protein
LGQNETRLTERSHFASRSFSMDVETLKIVREQPRLVRGLGLWAATAIVIGGMIGQSVFLVASDMSREVGSLIKVLLAWIVGGAIVLFGSFCYAELGAAMPEAGGDYVYQTRGLTPTSRPSSNATSPTPDPTSSTRWPGPIPASRKHCSVCGFTHCACRIKRSCSASVTPRG